MANSDSACLASGFCTSFNTQVRQGRDDGAMFVSNFHPDATQEELSEEVAPFRKYERLIMRVPFSPFHFLEQLGLLSRLIIIGPDSKYAFFVYSIRIVSNKYCMFTNEIFITVRGRSLRIERTENRPYGLSSGILANRLARRRVTVNEPNRTVPR